MTKEERIAQPFHIKLESALINLQKHVQITYNKKGFFTYLPNESIFDENGKITEESY
jgi:hypothetical protein